MQEAMQMSILVIGSLNMDISITTPRMPDMGETIEGGELYTSPGGKGGNQAIAAARLGGSVSFLGSVGEDMYGAQLKENLQKSNIKFYGSVSQKTATGAAIITICNGDNCIILNPGANELVTPDLIRENVSLFETADYVIMQLEIPVDSVLTAARQAKECGCKVILNPAPYKQLPKELLAYTDILIPNEHEAALLTNITIIDNATAVDALRAIQAAGVETTVITLGSEGCVYNIKDELFFCKARKTTCVDTTAAGDTFIGGLTAMLDKGSSLSAAIEFATAAASVTVSRYGAADSIPTLDEVTAIL